MSAIAAFSAAFSKLCDKVSFSLWPIISPSESLYIRNGNIVIFSRPTAGIITAFKLYREVLVIHSEHFQDAFSDYRMSEQSRKKYDGAPVFLLDDDAAELSVFLKALHDRTCMPTRLDFYISFQKVECIFRLSDKYLCGNMLRFLRATFSGIWPKCLVHWDGILEDRKDDAETPEDYVLRAALPEPSSAICLARSYGVPEILPAAFYRMFCLSHEASKGGSVPQREWGIDFDPIPREVALLSTEDLQRFSRGREDILRFMVQVYEEAKRNITGHHNNSDDNCCKETMSLLTLESTSDALFLLNSRRALDEIPQLCNICVRSYCDVIRTARSELYASLPRIFNLVSQA